MKLFILVAMCDLVHSLEALFNLSYMLTASENLFLQIAVNWAFLIF